MAASIVLSILNYTLSTCPYIPDYNPYYIYPVAKSTIALSCISNLGMIGNY